MADESMRHPLDAAARQRWEQQIKKDASKLDKERVRDGSRAKNVLLQTAARTYVSPMAQSLIASRLRPYGQVAGMAARAANVSAWPRAAGRFVGGNRVLNRAMHEAGDVYGAVRQAATALRVRRDAAVAAHRLYRQAAEQAALGKLHRNPFMLEAAERMLRGAYHSSRRAYGEAAHRIGKYLHRAERFVESDAPRAAGRFVGRHPKVFGIGDSTVAKGVRAVRKGVGAAAKWTVKGPYEGLKWVAGQPGKLARFIPVTNVAGRTTAQLIGPKAGPSAIAFGRGFNALVQGIEAWDDVGQLGATQRMYVDTGDGKRHKVKWSNPGMADAVFSAKMAEGLVRGTVDALGDLALGAFGTDGWLYKTDSEWDWGSGDYESYKRGQDRMARLLEEGYNPVTGEALRDASTGENLSGAIAAQNRKLAKSLRDARLEAIYSRSFDPEYYRKNKAQVDEAFKEMSAGGVTQDDLDPDRPTLAAVGGPTEKPFVQTATPWAVDADGLRAELSRKKQIRDDRLAAIDDNVLNWDVWSKEHAAMLNAMSGGAGMTAEDYRARAYDNVLREHEISTSRLLSANAARGVMDGNKSDLYNLIVGGVSDLSSDIDRGDNFARYFSDAWSELPDDLKLAFGGGSLYNRLAQPGE